MQPKSRQLPQLMKVWASSADNPHIISACELLVGRALSLSITVCAWAVCCLCLLPLPSAVSSARLVSPCCACFLAAVAAHSLSCSCSICTCHTTDIANRCRRETAALVACRMPCCNMQACNQSKSTELPNQQTRQLPSLQPSKPATVLR